MTTFTNYQPGPRGINLKDGSTVWLDHGESQDIDADQIVGKVPDLGREPQEVADEAATLDALRQENDALKLRIAQLEAAQTGGEEPGPLDQSVDKLTAYLETVTDPDQIEQLIAAEKAGKSRSGAISALEARRDALLA